MRIYIWGTGRLVGTVLGNIIDENQIWGFIDNNPRIKKFMNKDVFQPHEMLDKEYDAILVITIYSQEIYEQCKQIGLDINKVIFIYNNFRKDDINTNYDLAELILGKDYTDVIKNRYALIRKNIAAETQGRTLLSGYTEMDFVRIKTFEMVSEEIKNNGMEGAVAEVGVFRGEFAQYINAAFPDRKCYLFDTFSGFDEHEASNEIDSGNATNAFIHAYKNTNIELVMEKMKYPDQVVIKQGLFPDSLDGLDETFVFVSIDVDFEKSIFDCLSYFYPRVKKGGYIFVHDYNSALKGVKKAVCEYERINAVLLTKIPLCDAQGSLVIAK